MMANKLILKLSKSNMILIKPNDLNNKVKSSTMTLFLKFLLLIARNT